jgi:hypothetical protein
VPVPEPVRTDRGYKHIAGFFHKTPFLAANQLYFPGPDLQEPENNAGPENPALQINSVIRFR